MAGYVPTYAPQRLTVSRLQVDVTALRAVLLEMQAAVHGNAATPVAEGPAESARLRNSHKVRGACTCALRF